MSVESTEINGRPEQLVIPPDWQIEPVQPPPRSMFQPVKLITHEEIEANEKLLAYETSIYVSSFGDLQDLEIFTLLGRNSTCNRSPSIFTEGGVSRIEMATVEALIMAREEHIILTPDSKTYTCLRKGSENEELIKKSLGPDSFISRLLIVATNQERGASFLCRPRGRESSLYKGQLDIPGGKLKLTEAAKEDLRNPPIVSTSRALTETFSGGATREYLEEFGTLIPAIQFRIGSFITFVTNGSDSFLEVTELAVISSLDLEALQMLGNLRRAQGITLGNEWQIKDINTVLQEGQPMLPTLYAVLSRFKGQYVYEYEGWQIYGEYIPYNQTFFATRGKEVEI